MKTKSSPATAAPVAPAAGLKRINLAGISTTAPAAKAAKTYPELPDPDGQVAALVEGAAARGHRLVLGGRLYSDSLGDPGGAGGSLEAALEANVERIVAALGPAPAAAAEPAAP
jgi:manganese/zinc/iron transport system substrate-binding protein